VFGQDYRVRWEQDPQDALDAFVDSVFGMRFPASHPVWKKSSHSSWPPEQWALNVIWGMNKWAYL